MSYALVIILLGHRILFFLCAIGMNGVCCDKLTGLVILYLFTLHISFFLHKKVMVVRVVNIIAVIHISGTLLRLY